MSTFEVKVIKINAIETIPTADAIELAVVGDYRSVVRKDQYKAGDLAVYIPEAAILPDWLIKEMGLEGKLAGNNKNRVKAVKLRGCLSQGLLYPVVNNILELKDDDVHVKLDASVAQALGIVKYEPVIPTSMAGEVYNAGLEYTVKYDIENIKKFPSVLTEGEEVVFSEKIHGTFCGVGVLPETEADGRHFERRIVLFSKGLGAQGLCFKPNEANTNNVYVRAMRQNGIFEKLLSYLGKQADPVFLLGEVYGPGVQDLTYGDKLNFRVFDAVAKVNSQLVYWNVDTMQAICKNMNIETVPFLYRGPFSKELMMQYTSGKETVSGKEIHTREGIVIKPGQERREPELGRVILKSVSQEYLLRKGDTTEFN